VSNEPEPTMLAMQTENNVPVEVDVGFCSPFYPLRTRNGAHLALFRDGSMCRGAQGGAGEVGKLSDYG
jgi:hypothetical protein